MLNRQPSTVDRGPLYPRIGFDVQNGKTGLWVAMAMLAASVVSVGQASAATVARVSPWKAVPEPVVSPEHVSHVVEARFVKEGRRTTVVVMNDGRSVESGRPIEEWAASVAWPCFTLSVVDGAPRRVLVRQGAVVSVSESNFRRTNRARRDTLLGLVGGNVVVRESSRAVRSAVGLS